MPENCTLYAISVEVDVIDTVRTFDIEILTDPSGAGVVIGTLALPTSSRGASVTGLSAAVTAGTEIGARIVRSSSSGGSTFNAVVVNVVLVT